MHVKHCYPLEGERPITRSQDLYIALADREENIVKITLDKLDSLEEEPRQADPHSATFVKDDTLKKLYGALQLRNTPPSRKPNKWEAQGLKSFSKADQAG